MTGARFPGSSEKELLIYGRGKSQRTAKKQKHVPSASSPRPSIGSCPAAMNSSTTADPQDHSATSLRSSVSGALGEPATTSGSRALFRRGSNNTGEDDDNHHEGDRDSDNGSDFEDRYHNIIPSYKKIPGRGIWPVQIWFTRRNPLWSYESTAKSLVVRSRII